MKSESQDLDFLLADLKNKAEVEFFLRTDFIREVSIEAFDLYLRIGRREAKVQGFEERHSDMFSPRLDKYLKRFENDRNLYLSILRDMAIYYERVEVWTYSAFALNHTAEILADYLNSVIGIDEITGHETYTEAEKKTYGHLLHSKNEALTKDELISKEHTYMFVNNQIRSVCRWQLKIIEKRLLAPDSIESTTAPEESNDLSDSIHNTGKLSGNEAVNFMYVLNNANIRFDKAFAHNFFTLKQEIKPKAYTSRMTKAKDEGAVQVLAKVIDILAIRIKSSPALKEELRLALRKKGII